MTTRLHIPADAVARLHILNAPPVADFPFAVVIARPPLEAVPESLVTPGRIGTVLKVERGLSMPDAKGWAFATMVLEQGGPVGILFADLGDAMVCKSRLAAGQEGTQ